MSPFVYFLLCILATQLPPATSAAPKWKCNDADKAEIDKLIAQVMTYGWEDRDFPDSKAKLKPYCKETTSLLAQVDSYKNQCLKGEARSIVSVFIYSTKANFGQYCKNANSKKATNIYALAPCANSASRGFRTCSAQYADILAGINGKPALPSKAKIPQLCCGFLRVVKCAEKIVDQTKSCRPNDKEKTIEFLKSFFENSINSFCGQYTDTNDSCEGVKLLSGGAFKQGKTASKEPPPSLFSSLITVVANL